MLKVNWFAEKMHWVVQQHWSGLEYSLLSKENKQCFPLFYCKEFLLDAVWSCLHHELTDIFGFNYHPKKFPPVFLEQTRTLLRNANDRDFDKNVVMSVKFMNLLEAEFGFEKSKLYEVEDWPTNRPVVAVFSDKKWMHAPPLLSLYTLMLRVGMGYESGSAWSFLSDVRDGECRPICHSDGRYLMKAYDTIKKLAETKCSRFSKDMRDNWPGPKYVRDWDIHENFGIVALSEGDTSKWQTAGRRIMPQWFQNVNGEVK